MRRSCNAIRDPKNRSAPASNAACELREEQAAEEARQDADRQEEPRATRDPAGAIRRQAAAWDDAVQMRMMDEGLSPGVQHGEEADLGPEMFGIGGDRA